MTIPKRTLGSTGEQLSILGFGGILVMDETDADAKVYVSEAVDRGINYFDVAPSYGNAQQQLGPALKPYRDQVFLACKTTQRSAEESRKELEQSLRDLHTDHFDLYQFHAITTQEDVEQIFAPGGAMETYQKAKEEGKLRYIGFSAHSELAAHLAMDNYDFDTILFPLNFSTWFKGNFGPSVFERAQEKNMGILALKSMAHESLQEGSSPDRKYNKAWYQPLETRERIELALRFTLNLPVNAALTPGHWELFHLAMEIVESDIFGPLADEELQQLKELAEASKPIFSA